MLTHKFTHGERLLRSWSGEGPKGFPNRGAHPLRKKLALASFVTSSFRHFPMATLWTGFFAFLRCDKVCSLASRIINRVAYGNSPHFRDFLVKRFLPIALPLLVFAIVGSSHSTSASDWVSLFNGNDLSGWQNNGQEKWIVQDGTTLCESIAANTATSLPKKPSSTWASNSNPKPAATAACSCAPELPGSIQSTASKSRACRWKWTPISVSMPAACTKAAGTMPTEAGEKVFKPGRWNDWKSSLAATTLSRSSMACKSWPSPIPPRFVDGVVGLQIRTDGGVKMRKKDNASERNKQNFSGSS
jgi:hypothetical protein